MTRSNRQAIVLGEALVVVLCTAVLLSVPSPAVKAVASYCLNVALPGALLYRLIFRREKEHSIIDAILLALGLGYCYAALVTLGLHYVPGQLTRRLSLGLFDALLVLLLGAGFYWPYVGRVSRPSRREWLGMAGILALAALFRLPHLSYSEFQGDEVAVIHKAVGAIQGREDALFLHRKGPVEILLLLLPYAQGMALNEWGARLPYAMASLLAVLALYRLGVRSFGHRAGLWAGALAALNGFFAAFGRIVQYQSLVLFLGALSVLAVQLYIERRHNRTVWLAALFLSVGLLAHTDTVFAAVPMAWLIIADTPRPERGRRLWRICWGPALLGVLVLGVFYVPYVSSATFENTASYLAGRMGARPPYNNLGHLFEIGTVYNAVYYLFFIGGILLWLVLRRAALATRLRWVLPASFVILAIQAMYDPDIWSHQGKNWLGLLFLPLGLAALGTSDEDQSWRAALVWFLVPFMVYMFLFDDPRTHVYVFFAGAALVVGRQLSDWQDALQDRSWVVSLAAAPWGIASAAYLLLLLVSHTPEYLRTYPTHRVPFFWTPYGEEMPSQGLFGFPNRAGWKAVGQLYEDHILVGDYGTNEEQHVTRWYTRSQPYSKRDPRYFVVAENVQDEQKIPMGSIEKDYALIGRVLVGGEPKIHIYERDLEDSVVVDYEVAALEGRYDRQSTSPWYDPELTILDPLGGMQVAVGAVLAEKIELVGYAIDSEVLSATQSLTVSLYWRALEPIEDSYKVFVHVEDPGVVWAQRDGTPRAGNAPTNEWEVGDIVIDRYTLWLQVDAPVGPHDLVVGMYDENTGQRLALSQGTGADDDTAILLRPIHVETSP